MSIISDPDSENDTPENTGPKRPAHMTAAEKAATDRMMIALGIRHSDEHGRITEPDVRPTMGLDTLAQGPPGPQISTEHQDTGRVNIPPPSVASQAAMAAHILQSFGIRSIEQRSQDAQRSGASEPFPAAQETEAGAQTPSRRPSMPIMEPIFIPSGTGQDNMSRRTPIVATPETPSYTTDHSTSPLKAAYFRARGQAPIPLTEQQKEDAQSLRNMAMEFAILSNNRYIPEGLTVNDLMRLFVARDADELKQANLIYRLMAAEIMALKKSKKDADTEVGNLHERVHDLEALKQRLDDLEGHMYDTGVVPEAGELGAEPAQGPQAASGEQEQAGHTSRSKADVQKMNYMAKTKVFEGHMATPFRSWQEWSDEFMQRAVVMDLSEDLYYSAASLQLSQPVRDAWVTYARENPAILAGTPAEQWTNLQKYMQAHHGPLDKASEAEKRFKGQQMTHESEKAMQAYANIQIRNITEMGSDSTLSSKGIWETFLKGLPPHVRTTATSVYTTEKESYDAQDPISRITRMQERLMPQLRIDSHTQSGEASGPQTPRSRKRAADSPGYHSGAQPASSKTPRSARQPVSSIQYYQIPQDVTADSCPDVGYKSETQSKPYNHSLNQVLLQERRCLACWQPGCSLSRCPSITPEIARGMNAPSTGATHTRCAPAPAPSIQVDTGHHVGDSDTQDHMVNLETDTLHTRRPWTGAGEGATAAAAAGAPTGAAGMEMPGAEAPQDREHLVATQGPGVDPEQGQYSRQSLIGAHVLNADSSSGTYARLNMMGVGKSKLANVHYMFDPDEIRELAEQTRPFTRDGICKRSSTQESCLCTGCLLPTR